jgi:hypothetical protein
MQWSDYNFTSVTCEKSASSLTLPNTTVSLYWYAWFPPAVEILDYWTSEESSLMRFGKYSSGIEFPTGFPNYSNASFKADEVI